MNQGPRRRRSELNDGGNGGSGLPIVPLVIVVVLLGLLLGAVLAHIFGNGGSQAAPTPMPSITPIPTPLPTAAESPTPRPHPTHTPRPTPKASARPTATPSASPTATPTVAPAASAVIIITPAPKRSARPTPTIIATARPVATIRPTAPPPTRAPRPAATATPLNPQNATGRSGASAIVRAYVGALMRGQHALATSYLASGEPTESFLEAGTVVNDISATPNADGTYRVTADVLNPDNQEYFITFSVAPGPYGMRITSHHAIKPH